MNGKPGKCAPAAPPQAEIDGFRARHLALAQRQIATEFGRDSVTVDESESPLAWLVRRKGRDGRPLIETHQFLAGERLRADFTYANLMPRTTSNWQSTMSSGRRCTSNPTADTDKMIAARQQVHLALDAVGPEFSGLLLDVCCFLKGLPEIERDRAWPLRSGKVVLQLALDRLARHYGYAAQATGRTRAAVRTWLAEDAAFSVDSA